MAGEEAGTATAGDSNGTGDLAPAADQERFRRGIEVMDRVVGPQGRQVVERLQEVAPDLGHHVAAHVYGDIVGRAGLDARERQLVTIGMLTALGGAGTQLKWHIAAGLTVGLTAGEIIEALMQSSAYCGFPRALNAVFAAAEVFDEKKAAAAGRPATSRHTG
jgi:4-carboxymuconolactone decarboxylase